MKQSEYLRMQSPRGCKELSAEAADMRLFSHWMISNYLGKKGETQGTTCFPAAP